VPARIIVDSQRIQIYNPVGNVLRAEQPRLGLAVVDHDAAAVLAASVRYSDFAPVYLDIALTSTRTGQTLWSAHISRQWDIYASVVSASESNARKAVKLLHQDLARARDRT
jgi:hypothetical protein